MANAICDNAIKLLMNGGLDLDTDTIRFILVGSSFSWDPATDVYVSDIATLDEQGTGSTSTGYSRGTLSGKSVTQGSSLAYFDATDYAYTFLAESTSVPAIKGLLLYKSVTSDSDSPIIGFFDFSTVYYGGGSKTTFAWNASGILSISRKSGS